MVHATETRAFAPSRRHRALAVACLVLAATCGCEKDFTLVEPPDFFDFDQSNAWRSCSADVPGAPQQEFVPPPPGIALEVCPNPAPAGTETILFRFELDIRVPSVNLGIIDDRGRLVRELVVDQTFDTDIFHEVTWFVLDTPPGDYRAYFRAGTLESNGDVRIEP